MSEDVWEEYMETGDLAVRNRLVLTYVPLVKHIVYLWTRIHGAVLDELRRSDWAPRSLRRLERDLGRARETFTGAHGRPPTRTELPDRSCCTCGT